MRRKLAMIIGCAWLLAGCPGEGPAKRRDGAVLSDFRKPPPGRQDLGGPGPDQGGGCSPAGTPATCDPVAGTGCAQGTCYVVKNVGVACVCPVGTVQEGANCNTTTECAPGFGCAGDAPPGTCAKWCDTGKQDCVQGQHCAELKAFAGQLTTGLCKKDCDPADANSCGATQKCAKDEKSGKYWCVAK